MSNTDRNWRTWAEQDPYYAVLTDPKFRSDAINDNRAAFFESGQAFVRHWLHYIEHHFGPLQRERALDFGCGVGRLTIPLADHFGTVVGLDIAPAMLEEARRNSAGTNTEYLLSDDSLSLVEGTFDFVNSCIVLQHIPVARGMAILAGLLDRIRPGGGCLIQLSTTRNHSWHRKLQYAVRHRVPGGQAVTNLLAGRPIRAPVMEMNEYSLDAVMRTFNRIGFQEVLVRHEDHGGTDTAMIFARRA